ncbi:nucleotide exchange factor GrpE [Corallococcus sp. AB032C]|uniref:nucleotide exchange factor GrpE n=1 Tax=Corallococcus sp. AB032C TaxID=2316717 RepID=UPI000EE01050|nr:nucleotide exchange factor GrpE [Corallococcus sp. AB032C]NPC52283.1 nucleotide exchange factor GrpE [Corallococcus exiguus]RKH82743.1 nucleotide exchange factor GrpE [Corallococcus sp. AB032C]
MSGTKDKDSLQTDIGQDVIDEAVRSVERRMDGDADSAGSETEVELDVSAPAAEADVSTPEVAPPTEDAAALRQEVESLRAQLEFSQTKARETLERLKEAHERAKDFQDRAIRSAADLENYRKRAQKEKEDVQKFGVEKLLKDLLPVVDNMDRALDAASKSPDFDSFQKGVAMTRKSFEDSLGRHGVKGFSAKGQPFDPRLHEAIQQVESAEVPAGHVLFEVTRGFHLNDRLVRPAMVVVARAPEVVAAPEPVAAAPEAAAPAAGTEAPKASEEGKSAEPQTSAPSDSSSGGSQ